MKFYPLYPGQVEWLLRLFVDCHKAFLDRRPVDQALSAAFRKNKQLGSKDRKFYSTAIFGLYRYWGWLGETCEKDPLLALYFAYALEEKIPAPWWAETFKQPPLTQNLPDLAAKLSFWQTQQPNASYADLTPPFIPALDVATLAGLSKRPNTWVRVYRDGEMKQKLQTGTLKARQHPNLPEAWELLEGFNQAELRGEAEIQDLASQAVASVCAPQPQSNWLDYCAGAGGKSLHLAQKQPSGSFTLCDTRAEILDKAFQRTEVAGLQGFKFLPLGDEAEADPLAGLLFDGVLVDVPCSGSGTWARAPWLRWQLQLNELLALEQTQKEILEQAASKVRLGGSLVYSTCSLVETENQAVIGAFLSAHPGFRLEPFENPLSGEATSGELVILPQEEGCNGMYICKMVRVA